jgi:hypothetical protein
MKRYIGATLISAVLGGILLLGGCSYVSVQSHEYLGVPKYPPTDPAAIEILHAPPKEPCDRIGEITLEPQGSPSTKDIEDKLRNRAAQMGADAVVIVADTTRMMGAYWTGPWWDGQVYPEWGRVIVAVAIRYRQQGEPGPQSPKGGEKPGKDMKDTKFT